jgi:hypothetical protein
MRKLAGSEAEKVISKCRETGMLVRLVPEWHEIHIPVAQVIAVNGVLLVSLEGPSISAAALRFKRTVDLVGGLFPSIT